MRRGTTTGQKWIQEQLVANTKLTGGAQKMEKRGLRGRFTTWVNLDGPTLQMKVLRHLTVLNVAARGQRLVSSN